MNLAAFVFLGTMILQGSAGASLAGTVVDSSGKPIAGARVDIATAAPRVGPGLFCPSCYRDCGKSTRSDERGRFEIGGLDPKLKFTLLVSTPGNKACMTKLLDPFSDEPRITLEPLPADVPVERIIAVELVNDTGRPVAGALLEPVGGKTADRRWGGRTDGVDPTVSDAEGRCKIFLPEGYQGVDVQVTAAAYAGTTVTLLKPRPAPHRIVVPAGTRVTGRVVHQGRPMPNLRVAVVQLERGFAHHFIKAVVTGKDGRFACDYLPANEPYAIFTLVGEGPQKFVLTTKRFGARADREDRDLGDLEVIPARRLAGRVEFGPGQKLPANARITLSREPAWDLIAVPIAKDGTFVIDGLPPETYEVRLAAKGFQIDPSRIGYQVLGAQSFGVRLEESIENIHIVATRGTP